MKIVVTGGTGFIGRALVDRLVRDGHEVVVFTRRPSAERIPGRLRLVTWQGGDEDGARAELADAEAVFHLAGEPAVGRRLTKELAAEIRASRVDSTATLVRMIEKNEKRPRVFVGSSGVGYYGARPADEKLSESSSPGDDFLARLCVEWEAAASAAEKLGVRVVNARTGIVFGRDGGALEAMARPFKFFVGGKIGSGEQVVSWIHLTDMVRALVFVLENETLRGPVNMTAPMPVNNAELTRILADVLHRPALAPVPAFALRLLFAEGAEPILTGQRALPNQLLLHGFDFHYESARAAVEEALGPEP